MPIDQMERHKEPEKENPRLRLAVSDTCVCGMEALTLPAWLLHQHWAPSLRGIDCYQGPTARDSLRTVTGRHLLAHVPFQGRLAGGGRLLRMCYDPSSRQPCLRGAWTSSQNLYHAFVLAGGGRL